MVKDLSEALVRMPVDHYLRFTNEHPHEDNDLVMPCVTLMQATPEGGWPPPCLPIFKYDDKCVSSVSARSPAEIWPLLVRMLNNHFGLFEPVAKNP